MSKEAFINDICKQIDETASIDRESIVKYLIENYPADSYIPEGFEKIPEMAMMLTLTECIESFNKETRTEDAVRALVYSLALIEGRKYKIDIFKVKDDFEIERLIEEYKMKEEKSNED